MLRLSVVVLLISILVAACAPNGDGATPGATKPPPDEPVTSQTPTPPTENDPNAPQPGDDSLSRGPVFIDSAEILAAESYPVQYFVSLTGNLPTPCHQLRALVHQPDAQNTIMVEVYSVTDPEVLCAQVLQGFESRVRLPDALAPGAYTVSINADILLDLAVQ